ncbi:hypothetical protein [Brevibacillus formosus]
MSNVNNVPYQIYFNHEGRRFFMKTMMQKLYVKVQGALQNQKGAQAIEWIALAGVVIAVFGAVITYFKGNPDGVGKSIGETLGNIIGDLDGK